MRENRPVRVLNDVLLPAMKEVGDKFGAGELILPFVLQSAEVMKKAVEHLEQFLEKAEGYTKGKVVLATVYGDVHDIGKSLVNTILSNNGYTVYDLGKQVPVNTIIDKAIEVGADAIGLSALLVSTSKQMPLCVQELDRRGLKIPVLIGGAAINRRFGRARCSSTASGRTSRASSTARMRSRAWRRWTSFQDPKRRDGFVAKRARGGAQRRLPSHAGRQGISAGDRQAASERRARRQSDSHAAVRDGWLQPRAGLRLLSRCNRAGQSHLIYDPDVHPGAMERLARSHASTFHVRKAASIYALSDYFARSTPATSMSPRSKW